jgi:3-hydroxyacyl-[acyl-carrier-protein] dehydratase
MPPQLLFDISKIDLDRVIYDQEAIRKINPQRGAMEHLNAIVHMNLANDGVEMVGYKNVHSDEFWVEGHIPGRPLLPGVIMIEAAAQLAGYATRLTTDWVGFIGFGGVEDFKFRAPVTPGCRMYILGKRIKARHRRLWCAVQGLVNGNIVFEGTVIGTVV